MKCKFASKKKSHPFKGKNICVFANILCDGEIEDKKDCPLWNRVNENE